MGSVRAVVEVLGRMLWCRLSWGDVLGNVEEA